MTMLPATHLNAHTRALAQPNRRELGALQHYGDWLTDRVLRVLAARFNHRNGDGTTFIPRIIESITFPPYYHLVVVDPEALWHFSKDRLIDGATLDALTGATQRIVRPITRIPDEAGGARHGIAYAVLLRDLQDADAPVARLPKLARLDLAAMPAQVTRGGLMIPLGVSERGAEWRALAELGHTLIVGATGAGKSNFTHTALAALLTQNEPEDLRVVLIDPKRSELTAWANARHVTNICFTPEQAQAALEDVVEEIDRRGDLFASALVRDVRGYNKSAATRLPYILVVIDECLDLVLADGARIERPLKTLAIRGRSAGAILWAATQHASAVVGLPRVVNVNLATRLVFRVNDLSAAQAAGCPGAQNISRDAPGRMLAKLNDAPMMLQAYYLADDELLAVAQSVSGQGTEVRGQGSGGASRVAESDRALLEWAARENGGYLTIEDIQARGGVGRNQARRIAEQLERRGWLAKDARADNRRRLTAEILGVLGLPV